MRNHFLRAAAAGGEAGPVNPYDLEYAFFEGTPANFARLSVGNNTGLFFKPDGTRFYTTDNGAGDRVIEWSLTTAWDIKGASYVQSFYVGGQETSPEGVHFKPDGTKMYIIGTASDSVYEYNLSTAWDISTASYSQGFSVSTQETAPYDLTFSADGSEMYITGYLSDGVIQYSLSTAWDVSTASHTATFSVSAQGTDFQGLYFKPDGTKFYMVRRNTERVYEYSLSTAWDVSTASYTQYGSIYGWTSIQSAVFMKPDGTKLFFIDFNLDHIHQWDLSTAWDASTLTFTQPSTDLYVPSIPPQTTAMYGMCMGDGGNALYLLDAGNDSIHQYSLSSPYAIETASYVQALSVATQDTSPSQPRFSSDGTEFYFVGFQNNSVYQYTLGTAWDISTASYSQSFSVATQDSVAKGVWFKPDGSLMFMLGHTDAVYKYNLSTAWDISTASYSGDSFSIGINVSWFSLAFNTEGTKMYVVTPTQTRIYQYALSTPWGITTATLDYTFSVYEPYTTSPSSLDFNDNGSKLFMSGYGGTPRVWAFTIS